jgi:hypothetical protein
MAEITEEQPHYNTLSTIVRNPGFCIAQCFWKHHQYYPIVSLEGIENAS